MSRIGKRIGKPTVEQGPIEVPALPAPVKEPAVTEPEKVGVKQ